jgi:NADH-quinone oxidoreductase subunit N
MMIPDPLLPVITLALGALLALVLGSFTRQAAVGFMVVAATLLAAIFQLGLGPTYGPIAFEGGPALLNFTPFAVMAGALLAALGGGCLPLVWQGFAPERRRPELAVLLLLSVLGGVMLAAATHLLMVYVALELLSFPLYILCAWNRTEAKSSEAGLKYFVLGSLASGLLLFGVSFIYAATGALDFTSLSQTYTTHPSGLLLAGAVLMLAGIAFKLSWVPFHFYTPDVYEGAPTPVTAMLAAIPKLAVGVLLVSLLVGPLAGPTALGMAPLLASLAAASMVLGATMAIVQGNLKRLLAYSTIANLGFVAVPVVALANQPTAAAAVGVVFYVFIYGLTSVGLFAAIQAGNFKQVSDLKGLAKTQPWLAAAMGALLFSLAGIPPLAGFMAKFLAFLPAVQAGFGLLVILAVLMSVVASAYSLWLVKMMVFDAPVGHAQPQPWQVLHGLVGCCAFIVLVIGVAPGVLENWVAQAAASLF